MFTNLYRHWIWIGPFIFVLAAAALIYAISGVAATVKRARLFQVPLSAKQEVQFDNAGRVVLCTEGPRLSTRFASVKFELRGVDGDPVPGRRALFRARTSGISTARTEHTIFEIPRPGRYVLAMNGLGPARDTDRKHAVLFMAPHMARAMCFVVGIVVSSVLTIGSLVLFLLRLLQAAPET